MDLVVNIESILFFSFSQLYCYDKQVSFWCRSLPLHQLTFSNPFFDNNASPVMNVPNYVYSLNFERSNIVYIAHSGQHYLRTHTA